MNPGKKVFLTSKTSGEIEHDEVIVSQLFLTSVERGLESNLILHAKRPVPRSQGVTDEDILSYTQRGTADKRDRVRNFL